MGQFGKEDMITAIVHGLCGARAQYNIFSNPCVTPGYLGSGKSVEELLFCSMVSTNK